MRTASGTSVMKGWQLIIRSFRSYQLNFKPICQLSVVFVNLSYKLLLEVSFKRGQFSVKPHLHFKKL